MRQKGVGSKLEDSKPSRSLKPPLPVGTFKSCRIIELECRRYRRYDQVPPFLILCYEIWVCASLLPWNLITLQKAWYISTLSTPFLLRVGFAGSIEDSGRLGGTGDGGNERCEGPVLRARDGLHLIFSVSCTHILLPRCSLSIPSNTSIAGRQHQVNRTFSRGTQAPAASPQRIRIPRFRLAGLIKAFDEGIWIHDPLPRLYTLSSHTHTHIICG